MPNVICPECNEEAWIEGEELSNMADEIAEVECQHCDKKIGVFWYPCFDTVKMDDVEYKAHATPLDGAACPACEHCDISGDDGCLDCDDFVKWQAETSQSG